MSRRAMGLMLWSKIVFCRLWSYKCSGVGSRESENDGYPRGIFLLGTLT